MVGKLERPWLDLVVFLVCLWDLASFTQPSLWLSDFKKLGGLDGLDGKYAWQISAMVYFFGLELVSRTSEHEFWVEIWNVGFIISLGKIVCYTSLATVLAKFASREITSP